MLEIGNVLRVREVLPMSFWLLNMRPKSGMSYE